MSSAYSQVNNFGRTSYPSNKKTNYVHNLPVLNKLTVDTLSYKSFRKSKEDFDLINGCGNYDADQYNINIAVDDAGGQLCAWLDNRSGIWEIDAQLLSPNAEKLGGIIKLTDQYNSWISKPDIVFNKVSGEYIIIWGEAGNNIRIQGISKSGKKIGNIQNINQFNFIDASYPSGAVDKNGNILIIWNSENNSLTPTVLFYRLYDKDLKPLIDQTQLSKAPFESVSSVSMYKGVAADTSGNFIAVWSNYHGNYSSIILQQINSKGDLINTPAIINDTTNLDYPLFPTIASTDDGHFLFVWGTGNDVFGRIFKADSGFTTKQFLISAYPSGFSYGLCSDSKDNFYVANFDSYPYGFTVSKYGDIILKQQKIELPFQLYFANLAMAVDGSIYCVCDGQNKYDQDVTLEKIDTGFNAISRPIKLGDDYCSSFQTKPTVRYNKYGRSLTVWTDRRDGTYNLYGQVLDEDSNPVSGNFLINDTSSIYFTSNPCIASDKDGNFIICYSGANNSDQKLIIQKISSDGVKIGNPVTVSANPNYGYSTSVQSDSIGNLMIGWYNSDYYSYFSPCFLQKYDQNLNLIGTSVAFIRADKTHPQKIFSLSINKKFNILAMWSDIDTMSSQPTNALKAMLFNDKGFSISDTLYIQKMNDMNLYPGSCNVDDDNNLLFVWSSSLTNVVGVKLNIQRRYLVDKKALVYTNSYNVDFNNSQMNIINFENHKAFVSWNSYSYINSIYLDDNTHSYIPVRLHTFLPYMIGASDYYQFSADIFGDKLSLCYVNNINPDKGFDIWANTQQINLFDFNTNPYSIFNPDIIENVSAPFPNPVGSNVNINYQINREIKVKIAVYNILGQQISVIQDGMKEPGEYNAILNTKGLPSGIYFINYRGIKSYTQKFIIAK